MSASSSSSSSESSSSSSSSTSSTGESTLASLRRLHDQGIFAVSTFYLSVAKVEICLKVQIGAFRASIINFYRELQQSLDSHRLKLIYKLAFPAASVEEEQARGGATAEQIQARLSELDLCCDTFNRLNLHEVASDDTSAAAARAAQPHLSLPLVEQEERARVDAGLTKINDAFGEVYYNFMQRRVNALSALDSVYEEGLKLVEKDKKGLQEIIRTLDDSRTSRLSSLEKKQLNAAQLTELEQVRAQLSSLLDTHYRKEMRIHFVPVSNGKSFLAVFVITDQDAPQSVARVFDFCDNESKADHARLMSLDKIE